MREFSKLNPIVIFIYFLSVFVITIMCYNPIITIISLFSSLLLYVVAFGWKKLLKSFIYSLPFYILIAFSNPFFVRKGATILFSIKNFNYTLEALCYGFMVGGMLLSVIYLFNVYNYLMNEDKFNYIFGRFLPKLCLIFSMVLRYIPYYRRKYREYDEAQKVLGVYSYDGYYDKVASKVRVMNTLITNSLEDSIITADSMRSRGYGQKKITNFSFYKFRHFDIIFLICFISIFILCISLYLYFDMDFVFYPLIKVPSMNLYQIIVYVSFGIIIYLAIFYECMEVLKWKYLVSKI